MCYFCHCFGWTLDLIQRTITFALACCLGLAVCFGLSVAIIAGIAYGYNYCMAEFITFTRSDVTVYMRRGQFAEKPHETFLRNSRRSDESIDYFLSSNTSDYEEMSDSSASKNKLSDIWVKNQETKKYAEKLTKYSLVDKKPLENSPAAEMPVKHAKPSPFGYYLLTSPSPRIISVIPHLMQPTIIIQSGTSQILMREFQPDDLSQPQSYKSKAPEEITENDRPRARNTVKFPMIEDSLNVRNTLKASDVKEGWPNERNNLLMLEHATSPTKLSKRPQIPMRHWGPSEDPVIADYPVDEQEDDRLVYKPV